MPTKTKATEVHNTRELEGDEAWAVLKRVRYVPLAKKSIQRFRDASGMAYARAIGFQIMLAALPALIFAVALATWTDIDSVRTSIESVVSSVTPGSSSDGLVQQAVRQGEQNANGNTLALVFGGLAALFSGTAGMAQFMQSASRIYGTDQDRSFWRRYGVGLLLALTAGILLGGAFVAVAFGTGIAEAVEGESIWAWARWPLAVVGVIVALSVLYKVAPNRDQPDVSWLLVGGITATVLWILLSLGLALYLSLSSTFGDTYGPVAGLIGLALWAQLSGIAAILGMAFAAQLEAEAASG